MNGIGWSPCVTPCFLCSDNPQTITVYAEGGDNLYIIGAESCKGKDDPNKSIESLQVNFVNIDLITYEFESASIRFDNVDGHTFLKDTAYCCNEFLITKFSDHIAQGTFNTRLICDDIDCHDTIMVTNGVFDVNY
ncbi:MAG: hypothetical protein IPL65_15370 [Lewinellaceae bacterium]|nr:hypothetical protein [Lewinellaceae bacterium]